MTFLPPKDAKPADVERAAKTIEKRCSDFGYKGVTAKVTGTKEAPEIEVTCTTGITSAMNPHLVKLCSKVYKLELRFKPSLTTRELEQYEPGKTNPKDTEWVKDARTDKEYWHLFWTKTKVDLLGRITWVEKSKPDMYYNGPKEKYFEFDKGLTEWICKLTADQLKGACLLVDGILVHEGDPTIQLPASSVKSARWEGAWMLLENPTAPVRIGNPLPFPLELKK